MLPIGSSCSSENSGRSHRAATDGARTLALPGVSLFIIHAVGDGCCAVHCPGCHAEQVFSAGTEAPAFLHNEQACPVRRTIEAAIDAFRDGPMETHA